MALPDTVATMAYDSMEVSTSVHASKGVQDAAENSTAVTPPSKMVGDAETAAGPAAAVPPTTSQHTPGGALQLHSDMLLVGGKPGLFHCNYCMRDISNTIRIKCTSPGWETRRNRKERHRGKARIEAPHSAEKSYNSLLPFVSCPPFPSNTYIARHRRGGVDVS
jgi:hypothetical protein